MPVTTSLQTIAQGVIRQLWPGRYPLVEVATGGSTTTAVLASAVYSSGNANAYDGVGFYVVAGTTPLESRITRGGFAPTTGTFTLSPAIGATPNTLTCWWMYGFKRNELVEAINQVQNNLYVPAYLPISLTEDGNMEDTGVTNFAAVGTPTTRAKITTAARVLTGIRSLNVVSAATGDGVTSNTFGVHAGETLLVSVAQQYNSGSGQVILRRITATAADTKIAATVNQNAWTETRFQETVPTGALQMAVRWLAVTTVTDVALGWVNVWPTSRAIYELPSETVDARDIEGVYYLPAGFASVATDSYTAFQSALQPWPWEILQDWRGANAQRIQVQTPVTAPLFVKFRRPLPDLSADADITEAPEDLVIEGALAELKERLAARSHDEKEERRLRLEARTHAFAYQRMLDHYGLARPRIIGASQQRHIATMSG